MAAMPHDFDDDDADVSDINMVPLIDIMLVLLIVFMITLPVLTHGIKVDLPRAIVATDNLEPERVTVAVDAGGRVYWNDQPIDEAALHARLEAASQQDPQPELHIRGDRKAEYEYVLQVMAAAQRAGMLKLGFVTNPGEAGDRTLPAIDVDTTERQP